MLEKSTTQEIKERFDNDVDRFSNLETGQLSTIDAKVSLEILTDAAKYINPEATELLDIGCGAGNYTLTMLKKAPNLNSTLVDLSKPMLEKAYERITKETNNKVTIIQGDIREVDLPESTYDIILAGAVLHHLRDDDDWETTFNKLFKLLKKGGCLMISDLVTQDFSILNNFIWKQYEEYLTELGGKDYSLKVLDYIDKEDSPRSLNYQFELMKKVGFAQVEVLHKNLCFAAYCGVKA